jgi:hypothetical protein
MSDLSRFQLPPGLRAEDLRNASAQARSDADDASTYMRVVQIMAVAAVEIRRLDPIASGDCSLLDLENMAEELEANMRDARRSADRLRQCAEARK